MNGRLRNPVEQNRLPGARWRNIFVVDVVNRDQCQTSNLTSTGPVGGADAAASTMQVLCSPVASFACGGKLSDRQQKQEGEKEGEGRKTRKMEEKKRNKKTEEEENRKEDKKEDKRMEKKKKKK